MTEPELLVDPHRADVLLLVPGDPEPERGPAGSPLVGLFGTTAAAALNVGARWWPDQPVVDALLAGLAPGAAVSGAAVTAVTAELLLRERSGERVVATTPASGAPPYSALFTVTATGEAVDLARRALLGERGLLAVRYTAQLAVPRTATTVLSAVAGALPPHPADLETLHDEGVVVRVRLHLVDTPAAVVEEADRRALAALADAVATAPDPATLLTVTATVTGAAGGGIVRRADVGGWVRRGDLGHVHLLDAPTVAPPAAVRRLPVTVDLDDPAAMPVATAQLAVGDEVVDLRRPAPLADAPSAVLTVAYPGGGGRTATVARGPAGWAVGTADLGLVEVRVDAAAPRAAGARELELDVHYQPAGDGDPDRRTVRLGGDRWTARWWLATGAPGLDGQLVVVVRETPGDGGPVRRRTLTTADPLVQL